MIMVQKTANLLFFRFFIKSLLFLPKNFCALGKRLWGVAAAIFVSSALFLCLSTILPVNLSFVLLLLYILILLTIYAMVAVFICRGCFQKNFKDVKLAFKITEIKYALRLLFFWLFFGASLFFSAAGVVMIFQKMPRLEIAMIMLTMIALVFCATFFVLINFLPWLPSSVLQQNVTVGKIWKIGAGCRWKIFAGSSALILILLIFTSLLTTIFMSSEHNIFEMTALLLAGIAIFFFDVCSQTVFLTEVSSFLYSKENL